MILSDWYHSATRPPRLCAVLAAGGRRHGQIANLHWSEVEQDVIRLGPEKVKNKSELVLPLVSELLDIIERRRRVRVENWLPYVSDDIRRCF